MFKVYVKGFGRKPTALTFLNRFEAVAHFCHVSIEEAAAHHTMPRMIKEKSTGNLTAEYGDVAIFLVACDSEENNI
jgi:hypothetical protein